jgi:sugar phosphate permease
MVGVVTLVLAILVWLFVRDRPADKGWPSPAEVPGSKPVQVGLLEGMKQVLAYRWFWPVAVWFFFDCAVFFSFGGLWGGPYLMHIHGLTKGEAGKILSMLAVGMIVGSPTVSYLSNRVFRGRKPVLVLSALILVFVTGLLAFRTRELSIPSLYAICLGLGIFSSAIVVIGFTTTKELFPVQIAGTSTGLVNLFPFAGGAVAQPVLGYVLERNGRVGDTFTLAGYEQAFLLLFVCGVIAFLASLCLKETLVKE